ncbi:hypothetical protein [Streptomyces ziwulingensis]|uniref:Tat pathway signal sequence domain protein n=1 Tax=Streptomyces ziwulingensis TaxID=1045501 RepID=A0ABP9BVF6_9ACTN
MAEWNRRRVLLSGAAAAVAAGAGAQGAAAAAREGGGYPPVPGMRGDRRANEFWYAYEQRFAYVLTQEVKDAYTALDQVAGGSDLTVLERYEESRANGTYPGAYRSVMAPARDALAVLSRLQFELIDTYYRVRPALLPWAFVRLGDGSLYDPRMPDPNKVHMMNNGPGGEPTRSWHFWHAVIRAATLLDVSARRWTELDPLIGLGWATQSLMRPAADRNNPPTPRHAGERLVRSWQARTARQMDAAFDAFPYPARLL